MTQGNAKLIRIRPYRPSDSEQVRKLFMASMAEPTSFLQRVYDAQWRGPTACVSYCTFVLGLVLATFQTSSLRSHYIGVALCIAGCAIFTALHFTLSYNFSCYTKLALDGDLKDIAKTFGMKPVVDSNGERTGEYVPSGKTGFWVAEAYEKDSEIDDSRTEVIGSIGLDENESSDETSVKLCRMVVSQDYRGRGIAKSLIKTSLHHAQSHGVKSVVLYTTVFQPAAIGLYEKSGWVLQKKISVRFPLDKLWIFCYSLDLSAVKV